MSKQEAIGLIDKLLQLKSPSFGGPYEVTGYNGYFTDIAETLGNYRYTDGDDKKDVPFEDIVTKLVKQVIRYLLFNLQMDGMNLLSIWMKRLLIGQNLVQKHLCQ